MSTDDALTPKRDESHAEWTRRIGAHCTVCGKPSTGFHAACGALPCQADTTDPIAPDPPCPGYRRQVREAITRELTGGDHG
jgi:hypothetical protein